MACGKKDGIGKGVEMTPRMRLMVRLLAPVLVVSLLLLTVGGGSAWYLHRWNSRTSVALGRHLAAVVASVELVFAIRDTRALLVQYSTTTDKTFLKAAMSNQPRMERLLAEVQNAMAPDLGDHLAPIMQSQEDFFGTLTLEFKADTQRRTDFRDQLDERLLAPAILLLTENRLRADAENQMNQRMADLIGIGLLMLGASGAVAGLLSGYGITNAVSRSLDQLGGSMRSMAAALDEGDVHQELAGGQGLPALRTSVQRLAEKATATMRQLHESRKEVERAGQLAALGQLAAGLAHEIRNPLTSIKLLVQSALERPSGMARPELAVLEEEVIRLEHLLQTFLDFARPPRLQTQSVDLVKLVGDTVEFTRHRARQQSVDVHFEATADAIYVEADPHQIRQVALNLILNGIQIQTQGGRVDVSVDFDRNSELPGVVIRVADRGPGIAPELTEQIFEPFYSSNETGLGLGLSICQRIIDSHGGSIQVADQTGGGAEFRVCLPLPLESNPQPLH
jgi:two-component system sensor histidine kinase HydH